MEASDGAAEKPDDTWLLKPPAPDDAGAETQGSFHFQHECTARACIPMIVRRGVIAVVCEEHEDFVTFYEAAPPELVSVKHRDGSRGPWTFAALCTDGGVEHLFTRWLSTGKRAGCRVMTNGSLKTGTGQARPLADACHSRDADRIEPWVTKVAKQLEAESEDIREFLMVLSIEAGLPGKDHLGSVNITELVVPACETLKLDPSLAQGCYQRIVAAIARANRDAVGDPIDLLEVVGDPNRLDEEATHDRRLRRRRLDRDLIASLIFPPVTSVAQLELGADNLDAPAASRLRQKLEAGGLGPTVVDTAVELRASWYGFESSRRNDLPGGDPFFDDLRLRVRELAGLSESRVADPRHQYGPELHLDLRKTVSTQALPPVMRFPIDDQLLQGLIFQLTDECKVWWSPKFELRPT